MIKTRFIIFNVVINDGNGIYFKSQYESSNSPSKVAANNTLDRIRKQLK